MPTSSRTLRTLSVVLLAIPLMTCSEITTVHAQVQCWTAPQHEGPVTDKRASHNFKAMAAAEAILRQSLERFHPPIPVRMRMTMVTRLRESPVSRVIVRAYPEMASPGIGLWKGECGLISQVDHVAGPFGQISVFLNDVSRDMFMDQDEIPRLTGTIGGYPEYNGWVVISKNKRLPWIPQTLGERLDRIGAVRERALLEWQRTQFSRKQPDQAAIERTAALLRKTDAEGADKYVANMKRLVAEIKSAQLKDAVRRGHLTKLRDAYRVYRNSFTAEQLAMPVVWADADGSARQAMEAQINELQDLSVDEQQRVGEIREHSRILERQAVASDNETDAVRLRAQARELLQDIDHIRKEHMERAALEEEILRGTFELTNLKPGFAEQALAYKMDPTFPDRRQTGKIQVITVSTLTLSEQDVIGQLEQMTRKSWLDQLKSSIDYAALAALLD